MQRIKQDPGNAGEEAMEGRAATSSRNYRLRSSNHAAACDNPFRSNGPANIRSKHRRSTSSDPLILELEINSDYFDTEWHRTDVKRASNDSKFFSSNIDTKRLIWFYCRSYLRDKFGLCTRF